MSTITDNDIRKKIDENLSIISSKNLELVAEFIEFIKQKEETKIEPINYKPASGNSYLRHAGKWVGDDLEDCLQSVYENRGKVKINNRINPFQ